MNETISLSSGAYERVGLLLKEVLQSQPWKQAAALCRQTVASDGQIFLAGNGVSAVDAQRMACLLQTSALHQGGRRVRVQCLTLDGPMLTALANDEGVGRLFSAQLDLLGRPGDLFLAMSTSGNSANLVDALTMARARGMATLGLTGQGGGRMALLCDACVSVPSKEGDLIQDTHALLGRMLVNALRS